MQLPGPRAGDHRLLIACRPQAGAVWTPRCMTPPDDGFRLGQATRSLSCLASLPRRALQESTARLRRKPLTLPSLAAGRASFALKRPFPLREASEGLDEQRPFAPHLRTRRTMITTITSTITTASSRPTIFITLSSLSSSGFGSLTSDMPVPPRADTLPLPWTPESSCRHSTPRAAIVKSCVAERTWIPAGRLRAAAGGEAMRRPSARGG